MPKKMSIEISGFHICLCINKWINLILFLIGIKGHYFGHSLHCRWNFIHLKNLNKTTTRIEELIFHFPSNSKTLRLVCIYFYKKLNKGDRKEAVLGVWRPTLAAIFYSLLLWLKQFGFISLWRNSFGSNDRQKD